MLSLKTRKAHFWPLTLAGLLLALVFSLMAPAQAQAVTANVVAMDQVLTYNRMAAFNPAGMIFALARDVFPKSFTGPYTVANSCATVTCSPGDVKLRPDKRPRPLTLRVNEGHTIEITLTNLLGPDFNNVDAENEAPGIQLPVILSEQPRTKNVGFHINGMQWVNGPQDDGSKVGPTQDSLVAPGSSAPFTYYADKEGAYTVTSGPNLGGQGGNGAIANGLFGIVNVEPAGSVWYRSQLTRVEMEMATTGITAGGHPILNYNATYATGDYAGLPILKILNGTEIVHNEVNAIITPGTGGFNDPAPYALYPNRGEAFREFTVAFHDEIKVVQAFPEWYKQLAFTLGSVKDGFAINYGTGGIGSEIIGNRLGVGPMWPCVECKYEEFFLTSWAVGDPAMIVDIPANAGLENCDPALNNCTEVGPKATKAFYPDDPSNVWHGYLNDRTKIRNIHVGTEHHIFHLHAHQWNFINRDEDGETGGDQSNYLDAQAIGPGSSFTYEITFGGGGNRNKTAGDSIFHCHFYPHFAQGMWGLWRVHDTFEIGSLLDINGRVLARGLPDSEILGGGYEDDGTPIPGGTPTPAVVPIPGKAMAPMPGTFVASVDDDNDSGTPDVSVPFMGYPFYIPGVAGHRPPTPPIDLVRDGGIPRHVITGGTRHTEQTATNFDAELLTATGFQLPETGTPAELAAMAFHGPQPNLAGSVYHTGYRPEDGSVAYFEVNGLPPVAGAPYAEPCRGDAYDGGLGDPVGNPRFYAASVIELDVDFNKVGWHFGQQRILTLDGDVEATLDGTRAPEPLVMRANTRDCVDFDHTNQARHTYQLDDFQVKTPTDVIGQHIHLVKFDVTSADGAANGWNYEDGTLAKLEITERLHALKSVGGSWTGLGPDGILGTGDDTDASDLPLDATGFRTTRQRWYVDPGWSGNVFTHDHYGPSTHQQAGLYATVLVEPEGARFYDPVDGTELNLRASSDGGPTSWRADVHTSNPAESYREFYLEFADFQLAYRSAAGGDGAGLLNGANQAINPSYRNEVGLPDILLPKQAALSPNPTTDAVPGCGERTNGVWTGCAPEAISAADPGTFVVNYRNEPLALRLRDPATNDQAMGQAGDLSWAFSSRVRDRADARLNAQPEDWPYGIQSATIGAVKGDPFTPLLRTYEGDKVYLRVQVGAHEEGHNFSMNGIRWLQNWQSGVSGFRSSQMAGISEYFIFQVPALADVQAASADYLYQAGSSVDARWNGTWGLMRAYKSSQPDLQTLPSNPDGMVPIPSGKPKFQGPCPTETAGQNARKYKVWAVTAEDVLPGGAIEYNPDLIDPTGMLYVLEDDIDPVTGMLKAERRVEPLILRAAAGECIEVQLFNKLLDQAVTSVGSEEVFSCQPVDVTLEDGITIVQECDLATLAPVFTPEGAQAALDEFLLLVTADGTQVASIADIAFDEIPDADGFNTLPMIVNQFNNNQIKPSSEVGLHAQLVEYDVFDSDGMNVGLNQPRTVEAGKDKKYTWYAGRVDLNPATGERTAIPVEFGAINLMASDPIEGSSKGLIGALIIEPEGATWNDGSTTTTGRGKNRVTIEKPDGDWDSDGLLTRAAVTVTHPGGSFRDFVVIHQDDVNMQFANAVTFPCLNCNFAAGDPVPTVAAEEEPEDSGQKGINYRTDPIWLRLNIGPTADPGVTHTKDYTNAFAGDPVTPIYTAAPGDKVRVRILKPGGHNRNSVPTLHGFVWARYPYGSDSLTIDPDNDNTFWHGEQQGHGPTNHINVVPLHPAGPAGDYLYRDMVPVHVDNGEWAILRVE